MGSKQTVIVACVAKKLGRPAMAKELYQSQWFKSARLYAEKYGANWGILSAKYGFVKPEEIIEPYEKTLNNMTIRDRREWTDVVIEKLTGFCQQEIILLAGINYRQFLAPALVLHGHSVAVPMMGLGIGQQLAWLKKENSKVVAR